MTRRIVLVDIGQGMTLRGVLPSVALFASYSANVVARGGQGPYVYTIVEGAAALEAAGIYLDGATGEVMSSNVTLGGTFPLTIRATSITGAYVERSFVVVVIAEPLALSGTYPDAVVGVDYSADLQISGGDGNYSNPRVISGSLPAGLALSIVDSFLRLSGNATEATSRAPVVVAVDSAGGTATSMQSIAVTEALPAQYSDWRYKQIAADDGTDYSSPNFDDSAWAVGAAPFGSVEDGSSSSYAGPHAYDPRFAVNFATNWDADTRLWIRRTMTLDKVSPLGYVMTSFVEDSAHVYVNGTLVLATPVDPAIPSGYRTFVSPQVFMAGTNSLAVRCDDEPANPAISTTYADLILDVATEVDVVASLLHFEGADGSTVFTDATGKTWTRVGNAQLDTAQSKFGASSLLLDGISDYIRGPVSPDFNFGGGDFTIEMFARASAFNTSGYSFLYSHRKIYNSENQVSLAVETATKKLVAFYSNANSAARFAGGTVLTTGTWYHIALQRRGAFLEAYIDGQLQGSINIGTTVLPVPTVGPVIGIEGDSNNADQFEWTGHIDEVRVTKAVARYSSNFTPPTAPFPNP